MRRIATAVFKPDQRTNSLGMTLQHSVMLLNLRVCTMQLWVKHRLVLVNVSFTTTMAYFLKPTHVCGFPPHPVAMSSTL